MMDSYYIFETVNNVEKGGFDWLGFFGLGVQGLLLYITWRALNIWKKQLRGTDKYKIAFDLLLMIKELEEEIVAGTKDMVIKNNKRNEDFLKVIKNMENISDLHFYKYRSIRSKSRIVFNNKKLDELLEKLNFEINDALKTWVNNIENKEKNDCRVWSVNDRNKCLKGIIKIVSKIEILLKENYIIENNSFESYILKIKEFLFKK